MKERSDFEKSLYELLKKLIFWSITIGCIMFVIYLMGYS